MYKCVKEKAYNLSFNSKCARVNAFNTFTPAYLDFCRSKPLDLPQDQTKLLRIICIVLLAVAQSMPGLRTNDAIYPQPLFLLEILDSVGC